MQAGVAFLFEIWIFQEPRVGIQYTS